MVGDLQQAKVQVWLDDQLKGGDAWWSEICSQIRSCTVFLFALSDLSLYSRPCQAELEYAQALGLPILPVQIGELTSYRTDPMFNRQLIEYRQPSAAMGFALMAAIHESAAHHSEPPDPMPEPPEVPFEYLQRLGAVVHKRGAELSFSTQTQTLFELRNALSEEDDPSVRADIRSLLRTLRARTEVSRAIAGEIDTVLGDDSVSHTDAEQDTADSATRPSPEVAPTRDGSDSPLGSPTQPMPKAKAGSASSAQRAGGRTKILTVVVAVVRELLAPALALAAVGVALIGLGAAPLGGDLPPGAVTIAGADPTRSGEITVDLSKPILVTVAAPDADSVLLTLTVLGAPVARQETVLGAAPSGRSASLPPLVNRYLLGGRIPAQITVLRENTPVGSYRFVMIGTQHATVTAAAAAALVLAVIAGAYLEANLRVLRRGRDSVSAVLGVPLFAVGLSVAAVVAGWVLLGHPPTITTLAWAAGLAAAAGIAATIAASRAGRRSLDRRRRARTQELAALREYHGAGGQADRRAR